jgi:hypothetical protein
MLEHFLFYYFLLFFSLAPKNAFFIASKAFSLSSSETSTFSNSSFVS